MNEKTKFLLRDLKVMAWKGSTQRASIYAKNVKDSDKKAFQKKILKFINSEILPYYESELGKHQHLENIQRLKEKGDSLGVKLLSSKGYKYGIAQKLLNLYLKYHWCLRLI